MAGELGQSDGATSGAIMTGRDNTGVGKTVNVRRLPSAQVSILTLRLDSLHGAGVQQAAAEAAAMRAGQAAASLRSQLTAQRAHLASLQVHVADLATGA